MSVLPIVNPAHNADGIPLIPVINAIYPFALDEGSVSTTNCFLVQKTTVLGANQTIPVPIKITTKKLELLSNAESAIIDYGDDAQASLKYRTQISILPTNHLNEHSEYSVILGKDLSKISVHTPKAGVANIGTKIPLAKGPYMGLTATTYTIQIMVGGNENNAKFKVTRASDSFVFEDYTAKKRFIELEKGLFLKFDTGTYVAGDIFIINVKPLVRVNEIYSWDFKTGDSSYVQPSDSNSGVVVGLPIEHDTVTAPPTGVVFGLESISPAFNSVMNKPGKPGVALIQKIRIASRYRTNTFNDKRVKFILDNLAGLTLTVGASVDITFTSTTTKQELVDFINQSTTLVASTSFGTELLVEDTVGSLFAAGEVGGQVTFTFSKNLKTSSFSKEKIQILAESTAATYYGSIDFDYKIEDNKLIINFL